MHCILQVARELIGPEYIALGNGYLSCMVALGSLAAGPAAGIHQVLLICNISGQKGFD